MVILTKDDAVKAVRKNLDEIAPDDSMMFSATSGDNFENKSLDATIIETIPQAINFINFNVPAHMLDGVDVATLKGPGSEASPTREGNAYCFRIDETGYEVLRLVSVRAKDSENKQYGRVLTESVAEYSPEGHMQLNEYARGTWDNPVLVKMQGAKQTYTYYTLKGSSDTVVCKVMPVCVRENGVLWDSTSSGYKISEALRDNIVNQLTGMVLAIFGIMDKARYFIELANS